MFRQSALNKGKVLNFLKRKKTHPNSQKSSLVLELKNKMGLS